MSATMDGEKTVAEAEKESHSKFGYSSSSSFSSIGKNSDDEDEGGENEVESTYKGPLDMMESLEEVLPIKRGISQFYKGMSKSFRNLEEAVSLSVKDLGRSDNSYSRRRRNLVSHRIHSRGGIAKKHDKSGFTHTATTAMQLIEEDSSLRQHCKNLPLPLQPRQSKGSFGNCVPVVDSPRCFPTATGRSIHNIIC
ncbi:unnamed protein product [Cochlearia groenlandica]